MEETFPNQMDTIIWPEMKAKFTEVFLSKTRQEWSDVFDGTDACVTPILSLSEAAEHPHNVATGLFVKTADGASEPAPAPKLSRTPGTVANSKQPKVGEHTMEVLLECGYTNLQIDELEKDGVIYCEKPKSSL